MINPAGIAKALIGVALLPVLRAAGIAQAIMGDRTTWHIASRHLFSRERKALLSVITLISMTGVAVGVATLIIVIGVMDGALTVFHDKITNLYPHLSISSETDETLPVTTLLAQLRARPEVLSAEPVIKRPMIVQQQKGVEADKQGIQVFGIERFGKGGIFRDPSHPNLDLTLARGDLLVGAPTADKLLLTTGTMAVLINAAQLNSGAAGQASNVQRARVKGVFSTGYYDLDANTGFISSEDAHRIFGVPDDRADTILVRLRNPDQVDAVLASLHLPLEYSASTWRQESDEMMTSLRIQKYGMFLILLLITVVAAFNIIGTLILMVIDKTREVGILRAIGASADMIAGIFLIDGIFIGLIGTTFGVALGIVLSRLVPLIRVSSKIYFFEHLPVRIDSGTVLMIVVSSMLICTLAALFPAINAARLNPVEALRYD